MAYDPTTDFLALWRGTVSAAAERMPGLDFVVAALARAGLINLSVSGTAPVANQDTTAWLQTAVPGYSAEGELFLWDPDASAYAAAAPELLLRMLQACAGQNGVSWYETTGGPPANVVGLDGDYAIRTDNPGGIYGPKAAGAWPADPVPGTVDEVTSTALDNTFGVTEGNMIYRAAAGWEALAIGGESQVMVVASDVPTWSTLTALLDLLFSDTQGSLLYRDAAGWDALGPGAADEVLASGGPGANPAWAPRTAEFPSTTRMLFQQTAAPTGWTKDTSYQDYILRITAGVAGTHPGTGITLISAQTTVGDHTLTVDEIPAHTHTTSQTYGGAAQGGASMTGTVGTAPNTGSTGGGDPHNHSIDLDFSYVDVIIAEKD